MDNAIIARLTQGIRTIQSLLGETALINTITYPCLVGMETVHTPLEEGGLKSTGQASISIALQDILASPVPPAIGNPVLLVQRSLTYRVQTITPTQTTWELELQDVT